MSSHNSYTPVKLNIGSITLTYNPSLKRKTVIVYGWITGARIKRGNPTILVSREYKPLMEKE